MSSPEPPAAPSRPAAPPPETRRAVPELRALTGAVPELRALTGARGIAAWLVVLFHLRLSIAGLPGWAGAVLAKGYLAVDFFFLLSGFVLWLNYAPRLRAGGIAAAPDFLRRRIARIWPLHLFILAGALALALMLRATGRATPQFPLAELPLHILLVQNWGFTRALAWNDPAWSISCEFAAYLLFPAIAMAVDWRRLPIAARLAVLAAMFAALDAILTRAGAATLGDDIPRLGLVRCLIEFAAGGVVATIWAERRGRRGTAIAAAALALALAGAWIGGAVRETLAVPAAFAALLLALAIDAERPGNALGSRVPHALGEASYATYLAHYLLWFAFKLVLVDASHQVGPAKLALYLALVLASSFLLYRLVERPAQAWINARGRRGRR